MGYYEFLAWVLNNVDHGTGWVLDELREQGWPLSAAIEWIAVNDQRKDAA